MLKDKPNRAPDFVLGYWHFFFSEMVQWNDSQCTLYDIAVSENLVSFYDSKWDRWEDYDLVGDEGDSDKIFRSYIDWVIEKELLNAEVY